MLELSLFKERTSFLFIDGNNPPKNGSEKAKSEGARGPRRKRPPSRQQPRRPCAAANSCSNPTGGSASIQHLHHGGHPVLRWNASCLTTKEINDNLIFCKPERSRSSSRIDGISATVNALVRAIVAPAPQMWKVEGKRVTKPS